MRAFKIILISCFVFFGIQLYSQNELNRYLELAAKNNPGLQAKFKEYMASLESIPQAKALPDPELAFAYFIQPIETREGPQNFKISIGQMFPWFGTLKTAGKAAEQIAKAKFEGFLDSKSALFHEVRATYFQIYYQEQAIAINEENLQLLNDFLQIIEVRVESGQVSAADAYRVNIRIDELKALLDFLIDKRESLQFSFLKLLNQDSLVMPPIGEIDFLPLEESKEDSFLKVKENNHSLSALSYEIEAASYQQQLARKKALPNFSLGIDYTNIGEDAFSNNGKDAWMFPKIGISIPLNGKKNKAMKKQADLMKEAKELENNDKNNTLEVLFDQQWTNLIDSKRKANLYQSQIKLTNLSLQLLETAYSNGENKFEEVLDMYSTLLNYQLLKEQAKVNQLETSSFIHYLMGR